MPGIGGIGFFAAGLAGAFVVEGFFAGVVVAAGFFAVVDLEVFDGAVVFCGDAGDPDGVMCAPWDMSIPAGILSAVVPGVGMSIFP